MNPLEIIDNYTQDNPRLRQILTGHSSAVAQMALSIIEKKNLPMDKKFVEEAAMLHDIGIVKVDAPSIACFGSEPYICHGILGAQILRSLGLEAHARVAERHTGAGLTTEDIISQNLPLPHRDFLPETMEEKLICYADKFFSKSRDLSAAKPIEKIRAQMAAHGEDTAARFAALEALFT